MEEMLKNNFQMGHLTLAIEKGEKGEFFLKLSNFISDEYFRVINIKIF